MEPLLSYTLTQHPVGQGGFHTQEINYRGYEFRIIYDCGSKDHSSRISCISYYANEVSNADILFLSHLHDDHVNGVDQLLGNVSVKTVVLPYLSPFEKLALFIDSASHSESATSAVTMGPFYLDPVGWLSDRGVGQVVVVRRALPDSSVNLPQSDTNEGGGGEPLAADFAGLEKPNTEQEKRWQVRDDNVLGFMPSGSITLGASHSPMWIFAPYAYEGNKSTTIFRKEIIELFKKIDKTNDEDFIWLKAIQKAIQDKELLDKMIKIYKKHFWSSNLNLTSMSLFSGPLLSNDLYEVRFTCSKSVSQLRPFFHYDYYRGIRGWRGFVVPGNEASLGWLGTGDADLKGKNRYSDFRQFYQNVVDKTGIVMLPHHGSKDNWAIGNFKNWSACQWVAAYGVNNTHHHPSQQLLGYANCHGVAAEVTDDGSTIFTQSVAIYEH